jgi:hypothetical protein
MVQMMSELRAISIEDLGSGPAHQNHKTRAKREDEAGNEVLREVDSRR